MATCCLPLTVSRTVGYRARNITQISKVLTTSARSYKTAPIKSSYSTAPSPDLNPHVSSTTKLRPVYIPNSPSQSTEASSPSNEPKTEPNKSRITFSSTLAGPAMRAKYIEDLPSLQATGQGKYLAGIWIPPKPSEPDNCCMSGCVNCVWDGYREELEEWISRGKEARELAARAREELADDTIHDGDEDGMGSGSWGLDDAMGDIPVGIREFMKTEKRLQQERKEAAG